MEDPFIWRTDDEYEMIVKDMDGRICGQRGVSVHAFSEDGLHWALPEGRSGLLQGSPLGRWKGGSLERPFLLFENGKAAYAFFATSNGEDDFMTAQGTWNMVIPLKESE